MGWLVAADKLTTQAPRYANVLAFLDGRPLQDHDDGCPVCLLITGYNSVVMAECDCHQTPISSPLVDPTKERWSLWLLTAKLPPRLYGNRMIRGLPHESRWVRPLACGGCLV
jgi:sulfide:quinone oxidoreductase